MSNPKIIVSKSSSESFDSSSFEDENEDEEGVALNSIPQPIPLDTIVPVRDPEPELSWDSSQRSIQARLEWLAKSQRSSRGLEVMDGGYLVERPCDVSTASGVYNNSAHQTTNIEDPLSTSGSEQENAQFVSPSTEENSPEGDPLLLVDGSNQVKSKAASGEKRPGFFDRCVDHMNIMVQSKNFLVCVVFAILLLNGLGIALAFFALKKQPSPPGTDNNEIGDNSWNSNSTFPPVTPPPNLSLPTAPTWYPAPSPNLNP
ncbi:expressed unknown protein [Seminavis robusta]|uniref:Uncharacterized protein n=1 Tax=Seminavis robusta TaxID=568900 RepID=A0A9N8F4I2_9STRA|nr:expressed unknown protein [Seminavis robusta]|eukprot:Sro3491_g348560.1 n/a (259) ;mRNA; r:1791-2567